MTGRGGQARRGAAAADEGERICGGRNRDRQVVPAGTRKLFDAKRRSTFLEWFAATCNVKLSARKAGVVYQTVFKHRMKDPAFAEAWDRALDQGYARVEARMLEARVTEIEVDGDLVVDEVEDSHPEVALTLLREHKKSRGGQGTPFGVARRGVHTVKLATNGQVKTELERLLKLLQQRLDRRAGRTGDG